MTGRDKAVRPDGYAWTELLGLVELTLTQGVSCLVLGHPGVGKSALAAEVARRMGLPLIDIRLAQRDPAELGGVHFPDRDRGVLRLLVPEWVEQACAEPCMVFLDEINAAVTRLHQAAAYQIVLEKRVGTRAFHPSTVVMAAGNLPEDNAIVTPLSSALCNRFSHFVLRSDVDTWLEWAAAEGVHEAIIAYVARFGAEALYDNHGGNAFPSPRSWAMASRVMRAAADDLTARRAVAACVGVAAAEKLASFLRIYRRVNAAKLLKKRGKAMDFSTGKHAEPSFIYAAVFSVAAWLVREGELTDAELPNVVRFLCSPGLDPEYAFLFLRQLRAHPDLLVRLRAVPAFRELARQIVDLHAGLYA